MEGNQMPTDAKEAARRADITERELIGFVVKEARLLDEKRYAEWNALFSDDAYYWVPLVPDQEDGLNHTSHLYEDKLLRELRIERLKSPRAFSQQPPTRSHLLQTPTVESADAAAGTWVVRSEFLYTESQGDELNSFVGTCFHHLVLEGGALRMKLKRVNLINCDAALPAVQLFI
jgi:3-phenylpropionate/cinnamic acid dioxygenase small subunit